MVSDDEYLERIVAGIQTVTTDGADVTWNETLNGRQFDVVVRFTMGTLKYLVLIEVKNRSRKASASDIEAFATKADDHNANKAVFVTAAGFQSGAKDVAYRHGIDLFTVKIDQENVQLAPNASYVTLIKPGINVREPLRAWLSEPHLVALTYKVEIVYENGQVALMPGEQSQATYYGARTKLTDGRSITQILNMNGPQSISVVVAPQRPDTSSAVERSAMNSLGERYPSALCG